MVDVAERLVGRQRVQPVVHGDALTQLTQFVARQMRLEFGLSDQEDLQQLLALVLQVREQPDLLEQLHRKVLRFIQHEHGMLAARTHGHQMLLECHQRGGFADAGRQVQAEAKTDLLEHLLPTQRRVGDQRDGHAIAPLVQSVVQRCRLTRADLARDEQERLAVLDAVAQMRLRFLMLTARIDELELMTGGERVLAQAEVMFEHRRIPLGGTSMFIPPAGLSAGRGAGLRLLFGRGGRPKIAGIGGWVGATSGPVAGRRSRTEG